MSFYQLQAPTRWAEPPKVWNSTALDDASECPRRWQLLNSQWGDLERFPQRMKPSAIEDLIVHAALDRLTRACGLTGNPAIGSGGFARALEAADFFTGFAKAVADWNVRMQAHPRAGPPFQLRTSPDDLANRAIRLFREQYRSGGLAPATENAPPEASVGDALRLLLAQRRALSEVRLKHPDLAFVGVLDRVALSHEGIEIVDYKTGVPSSNHIRQLLRYAVLWWRNTGDAPKRVCDQYLGSSAIVPVRRGDLEATEAELDELNSTLSKALRERPAASRPGAHCVRCPARARCAEGWLRAEGSTQSEGHVDMELVVLGTPTAHGFVGLRPAQQKEVAVVYAPAIERHLPPFDIGSRVRVVDAVWSQDRAHLEFKPWTEVYEVDGTEPANSGQSRQDSAAGRVVGMYDGD